MITTLKTYSSLRLATGMLEKLTELNLQKNGKILLSNTESTRGLYYANEFEYDIVYITAPHSPEMYVKLIKYAESENYPILIIDSSSHEWEGEGGCLDIHNREGGTYQAWAKVTPRHNEFIQKIADSQIHIIATMRGKDQYEIEKSDTGKTTIKKLGVGAKQREGFEYEFTCTFNIDQKNSMATPQKDNTHIFENRKDSKLTEQDGIDIISWANSGSGFTVPVRTIVSETEKTNNNIADLQQKIIDIAKKCGGSKDLDTKNLMFSFEEKNGNPAKINDVKTLTDWLGKMNNLFKNKESATQIEKEESNEVQQ